ncbi:transporter suffix domain-containing protein [Candidatus Auribacterota bacterium]
MPIPIEKNWKFYTGISLFIFSYFPYLFAPFIPLLPVSHTAMISIAAISVTSAELIFFISILLLGKPFMVWMKAMAIKYIFRGKAASAPAYFAKIRHYLGVTLFCMSFIPYFVTEVAILIRDPQPHTLHIYLGVMLSGNALFIISLFVLGGDFWEKLKDLFVWQSKKIDIEQDNKGTRQ